MWQVVTQVESQAELLVESLEVIQEVSLVDT
jgi:hypothetical protein